MEKQHKIYIAGHTGMVGSALVRTLLNKGYTNLIYRTHDELDLTNQASVNNFFQLEQPDYVFIAAAKVGGIIANQTYPADFMMVNLLIACNLIHASFTYHVKKLMFLGSSCIYPKECSQPIKEEYLLTAPLETSNEAYALAKISGIKLCQHYNAQYKTFFLPVMPASIYGIYDNFDLNGSHVIPALIRKMHAAKINQDPFVDIWGSGTPLREFLYVDDLANACTFLMEHVSAPALLNVGSGKELSIRELALLIKQTVGYTGFLRFDATKPDGTYRKILDSRKINQMGWHPTIDLEEGLKRAYAFYLTTLA